MTPTGRGDPSAPPLMPGRALSRTRSLLAGRAFPDRAEFWWRYDPYTYDSWARILRDQKRKGRNVFGLSPAGLARVTARSWRAFGRQQAGKPGAGLPPPVVQPSPAAAPVILPMVGSTRMTYATTGIGAEPHAPGARTTGGLPWEKWLAFLRRPAAPPAGMVPTRRPFNELLNLIFGPTSRPSAPPPPPPKRPKPIPAKGRCPLPQAAADPRGRGAAPPTPSPIQPPQPRAVEGQADGGSADWRASLVGVERSAVVDYTNTMYRAVGSNTSAPRRHRGPDAQTPGDVATSIPPRRPGVVTRLDGKLQVFRGIEGRAGGRADKDNRSAPEITDAGYLPTSLDKDRGRSIPSASLTRRPSCGSPPPPAARRFGNTHRPPRTITLRPPRPHPPDRRVAPRQGRHQSINAGVVLGR